MVSPTDQTPPIITCCTEIVKRWDGRDERFFILTMKQGDRQILSFQISETEARESYQIEIRDGECPCERLASAVLNGWYTEVRRLRG